MLSLAHLAHKIIHSLKLKKAAKDTQDLENGIDALVYRLLRLIVDKIAVIEGNQGINPHRVKVRTNLYSMRVSLPEKFFINLIIDFYIYLAVIFHSENFPNACRHLEN